MLQTAALFLVWTVVISVQGRAKAIIRKTNLANIYHDYRILERETDEYLLNTIFNATKYRVISEIKHKYLYFLFIFFFVKNENRPALKAGAGRFAQIVTW
ncbi:MAG: hypothetical protein CMM48_11660 [Rhodospirillaceae bacterium]|nr:hypothetical protein [Rhodospirillaceae bacterium]